MTIPSFYAHTGHYRNWQEAPTMSLQSCSMRMLYRCQKAPLPLLRDIFPRAKLGERRSDVVANFCRRPYLVSPNL